MKLSEKLNVAGWASFAAGIGGIIYAGIGSMHFISQAMVSKAPVMFMGLSNNFGLASGVIGGLVVASAALRGASNVAETFETGVPTYQRERNLPWSPELQEQINAAGKKGVSIDKFYQDAGHDTRTQDVRDWYASRGYEYVGPGSPRHNQSRNSIFSDDMRLSGGFEKVRDSDGVQVFRSGGPRHSREIHQFTLGANSPAHVIM